MLKELKTFVKSNENIIFETENITMEKNTKDFCIEASSENYTTILVNIY